MPPSRTTVCIDFKKQQFDSHKSEAARPNIIRSSHKSQGSEAHNVPGRGPTFPASGGMAVPPFQFQVGRPSVTVGRPGTGRRLLGVPEAASKVHLVALLMAHHTARAPYLADQPAVGRIASRFFAL